MSLFTQQVSRCIKQMILHKLFPRQVTNAGGCPQVVNKRPCWILGQSTEGMHGQERECIPCSAKWPTVWCFLRVTDYRREKLYLVRAESLTLPFPQPPIPSGDSLTRQVTAKILTSFCPDRTSRRASNLTPSFMSSKRFSITIGGFRC